MSAREHFLDGFAAVRDRLPGAHLPWLRQAREAGLARFAEVGFPTTRHEDWKYTSVAAIERRAFRLDGSAAVGAHAFDPAPYALPGSHLLVFVDGRSLRGLSKLGRLPGGVRVASLAAALERPSAELPERDLAAGDAAETDGFAALNTAFWRDGALIELAPGAVLEAPVHLLFAVTTPEAACFPRNVVRLGRGAAATIVEHYVGIDDAAYLTDSVTRIEAGPGATLTHLRLQEEGARGFHIADLRTEQDAESRLESHAYGFGAMLSRAGVATRLVGEGARAELLGLYVGARRQHLDHHTSIDHAMPGGTSRELFKGVLDGAARAVFDGRVVVRAGAQRTDAQQTNHNLLLSEDAEVDTKPRLEIWADDVKCSHGATVGQLDPEQRYYLRTRGIDDAAARALLIHAFAAEVIGRVAYAPLRERLDRILAGRLPQQLGDAP